MARNDVLIAATPERVFDVLSDASLYADWVIGAQEVRAADATWPESGTKLEHSSGAGPLTVEDTTEVLESDPPRRLVLLARLGPLGSVRVELTLEQADGGTRVTMDEDPAEGAASVLHNRVSDLALEGRNVLSLRRLRELAEA